MDYDRYRHMKSVLRLYRLTMGQPRQEELLEFFKDMPAEDIDKLLFNLSPIKRMTGIEINENDSNEE